MQQESFNAAALGAGALLGGGNVLLGSSLQTMPGPGRLYLLSTAQAAGVTARVRQGVTVPLELVEVSATNAPPRNRDDVLAILAVKGGEQPIIDITNTTAGALAVWLKAVWVSLADIASDADMIYRG